MSAVLVYCKWTLNQDDDDDDDDDEFLEQSAIASVPVECKPKLWKRYVDDILEIIKKHGVDGLTEHLNSVDDSGSIKFTAEQEQDEQMPFLDTSLCVRQMDVSA